MKTKTLNSDKEFAVGQHGIGWLDPDLTNCFKDVDFEPRQLGTFQQLGRSMTADEFEKELKPGLCELGDVLAFLENPPEGTKDGWSNLFLVGSFVVHVRWYPSSQVWSVDCDKRDSSTWFGGPRVFSPATSNTLPPNTIPSALEHLSPSETMGEALTRIANALEIISSKV